MKRIRKNILGLSGLATVIGMTACAATLPSPEASAISSSLTETFVVNVVDDLPAVNITSSGPGEVSNPVFNYKLTYKHVSKVTVTLSYTNGDETSNAVLESIDNIEDGYDEKNLSVNVSNITFDNGATGGYGEYKITVTAIANDGTPYSDYLTFKYVPVSGSLITNGEGKLEIKMTNLGDDVAKIVVKTKDGVIVGSMTRAQLEANGMVLSLNLDKVGCQEILYLYAYDANDNLLPDQSTIETTCPEVPETGVPDTGGLFQNLNVSKEDYLVTGLIIFFVLGVVGFGIVARNHSAKTTNKKRH